MTESTLKVFDEFGVPIAPISGFVDAAVRLIADESVSGRAVSVAPASNFDLGDDPLGLDGGAGLLHLYSTLPGGMGQYDGLWDLIISSEGKKGSEIEG